MSTGSLTVVGTGIKLVSHITLETEAVITQAEKVFYLVNDPALSSWIEQRNETAESLDHYYGEQKLRLITYQEVVNHVLQAVRAGLQVCAIFYGHPGVFVLPGHIMIQQAQQEGFSAYMLPGVSAADCLYADLGIDPAHIGCQAYEATEFLLRKRRADPTTHLVMWQIGVVGELRQLQNRDVTAGLKLIVATLQQDYPPDHTVIIYEAAQYPMLSPTIQQTPLAQLPNCRVSAISTLYVPPTHLPPWDTDMMAKLNIQPEEIMWPAR